MLGNLRLLHMQNLLITFINLLLLMCPTSLSVILVLTIPRISSKLAEIDFMHLVIIFVAIIIQAFNLTLNVVDLAHVHTLVQQMLTLYLIIIQAWSISSLAGSTIVTSSGVFLLLLVVVLAHNAHLSGFLFDNSAFTASRLLYNRSLVSLGSGNFVLGGPMAAHKLHL